MTPLPLAAAAAVALLTASPVAADPTPAVPAAPSAATSTAAATSAPAAPAVSTATPAAPTAAASSTAAAPSVSALPTRAPQAPAPSAVADVPVLRLENVYLLSTVAADQGQVVRAGSLPQVALLMMLPSRSTYTNLTLTSTAAGSTAECSTAGLLEATRAGDGYLRCFLALPALSAGEARSYTVTLTGLRDGKPFTAQDTMSLYGAPVDIRVLLDGKDVTGTTPTVPLSRAATVTLVVTNRGTQTLHDLAPLPDGPSLCRIGTLAPGATGRCSFTLPAGDEDDFWGIGFYGQGAPGWFVTLDAYDTAIIHGAGPDAPPPAHSAGTGTASPSPSTTAITSRPSPRSTTTTPAATRSRDIGTPPEASGTQATPPLAQTGLDVGAGLALGLSAVLGGAAALVVARRR